VLSGWGDFAVVMGVTALIGACERRARTVRVARSLFTERLALSRPLASAVATAIARVLRGRGDTRIAAEGRLGLRRMRSRGKH
jgi:hypothetical protein